MELNEKNETYWESGEDNISSPFNFSFYPFEGFDFLLLFLISIPETKLFFLFQSFKFQQNSWHICVFVLRMEVVG